MDLLKAKAGDIVQKVTVHQSKDNVADGIRVERYEEGKEWRSDREQRIEYDRFVRNRVAKQKAESLLNDENDVKREAAVQIREAVELGFQDTESKLKAASLLKSHANDYSMLLLNETKSGLKPAVSKAEAAVQGGGLDVLMYMMRSDVLGVQLAVLDALSALVAVPSVAKALLHDPNVSVLLSLGFFSDNRLKCGAAGVLCLCSAHFPGNTIAKGGIPTLLAIAKSSTATAAQASALDGLLYMAECSEGRQQFHAYGGAEIVYKFTMSTRSYIQRCAAVLLVRMLAPSESMARLLRTNNLGVLPRCLTKCSSGPLVMSGIKAESLGLEVKLKHHITRVGIEIMDHILVRNTFKQVAECTSEWKTRCAEDILAAGENGDAGGEMQLLEKFVGDMEQILCEERRRTDLLIATAWQSQPGVESVSVFTRQIEMEQDNADLRAELQKQTLLVEQSSSVEESSTQVEEDNHELSELQESLAFIQKEIARVNKAVSKSTGKFNELKLQCDLKTSDIDAMKRDLNLLPGQIKEAKSEQRRLEKELKVVKQEAKELKTDIKFKSLS